MGQINESKETIIDGHMIDFIMDSSQILYDESLREERRRTGRYLATGIAIFIVVLGLYHAVSQGSTKYATLLGTVLIMFLYLLWLLYASQRKKKLMKLNEEHLKRQMGEAAAIIEIEKEKQVPKKTKLHRKYNSSHEIAVHKNFIKNQLNQPGLNRTYSIA
ncbi:unnamed protein product [Brassicogethes aeneus]|uniref:Uncharacterized protein n=1 Tax=Brassicogethes aeneus TaxID=1431903 RepID=A0A9P0ATU5_BRAAE|nr:unnamed protein product [Brassicogethes aeneus]